MKLENRKQKVASLQSFFIRMGKYTLFVFLLVFISVGIGTVGYHYIAELYWLDSFHMACMILTGMGPVEKMNSTNSKFFSSFFALYSGVAFLSMTAVFFAPVIHRLLHILHVEEENSKIY